MVTIYKFTAIGFYELYLDVYHMIAAILDHAELSKVNGCWIYVITESKHILRKYMWINFTQYQDFKAGSL